MPEITIFDENEGNGYAVDIMKKVLAQKILESPGWVILKVAELMFDSEPKANRFIANRFIEDDGMAITYPKDEDPVRDYLAAKMVSKLRYGVEL